MRAFYIRGKSSNQLATLQRRLVLMVPGRVTRIGTSRGAVEAAVER